MCIRDSPAAVHELDHLGGQPGLEQRLDQQVRRVRHVLGRCLLYTSDAADERSSVDLGGRRIIKKQKDQHNTAGRE